MRYLMILEVSQKQAYIFSSTRLQENIKNSEAICKVTDPQYFQKLAEKKIVEFDIQKNLVYAGGGHTILEFADEEHARDFAFQVSKTVKREFHDMELFIKIRKYDDCSTPGENLKQLSEDLEKKKSIRQASFHQGTFGVEKPDTNLRKPVASVFNHLEVDWKPQEEYVPEGYEKVEAFGDLGNQKDESSFIAVVHIDGNAMGKRVEKLRSQNENATWETYRNILKGFSDSIDADFKAAYKEMADEIKNALEENRLDKLELKGNKFPLRRIILAGDDVCFVTEGRIGIEAARIFLNKLSNKVNKQDHEGYTACAGIAVVHQKYPFYKAYEIAEMLCSNAKKYLASFQDIKDSGSKGCAIDWHIEYGTGMDNLSEIRKMYDTNDHNRLELRPYLVSGDELMKCDPYRNYDEFKKFIRHLERNIAEGKISRGKVKELRSALKEGEESAIYYMKSNMVEDLTFLEHEEKDIDVEKIKNGKGLDRNVFVETADGVRRSLLFDAIEMMDTYISLDEEEKA